MPSFSILKKLSAASGLVFGNFLAYHLFCHYSLYWKGWEAANESLVKGRVIYQNPVVEILLLVNVLVHMYSNTMLYLYRRQNTKSENNKNTSAELKAHRIAGYVMGFSIIGHVAATRLAPLVVLENPSVYDYGFVHAAAGHLGGAPFYVYLAMFAMAGGWHLLGVWHSECSCDSLGYFCREQAHAHLSQSHGNDQPCLYHPRPFGSIGILL